MISRDSRFLAKFEIKTTTANLLVNSGVHHEIRREKVVNTFDICGTLWIKHFCLRQHEKKQPELQRMSMDSLRNRFD